MKILRNTLKLKKRECKTKMRLVPYGGGWNDVYVIFEDEELYFVITEMWGDNFNSLLRALYFLYPEQRDPECADHFMEYKYGICDMDKDYEVIKVVESMSEVPPNTGVDFIPWKTEFEWTDEHTSATWCIERVPDESTDFDITIKIDRTDDDPGHYKYKVPYKDMCYAVADACTKALKKHGFLGYHAATFNEDMSIRYLLFLKSIALKNQTIIDIQYFKEKGEGERSDLMKELELLLFDMS